MLNKKIEYFVTLAECLSFTQAAAAHSVSQTAISQMCIRDRLRHQRHPHHSRGVHHLLQADRLGLWFLLLRPHCSVLRHLRVCLPLPPAVLAHELRPVLRCPDRLPRCLLYTSVSQNDGGDP